MRTLIMLFIAASLTFGCKSNKTPESEGSDVNIENRDNQRPNRKGPPSVDEVFKMDTNMDGLLDKTEVDERLLRNFDNFDSNGDGLISRAEFENAPKPKRGKRPQKR